MDFNIDAVPLDFPCPVCQFYNTVTYRDARLGEAIICRGCKNTLKLDDAEGELSAAHRRLTQAMNDLTDTLKRLGS